MILPLQNSQNSKKNDSNDPPIIKQLARIATPEIVDKMRVLLKDASNLFSMKPSRVLGRTQDCIFKHHYCELEYVLNTDELKCTCFTFEQMGYPCGHTLAYMKNQNMQASEVPLLDRWKIDYELSSTELWNEIFSLTNQDTRQPSTTEDTQAQQQEAPQQEMARIRLEQVFLVVN